MSLLINLSFLLTKPTGTTTYANNILPELKKLEPTLLTSQFFPDFNCYQTDPDRTSEQGISGHIQRLIWIQLKLPQIYQQLNANLLFSPIPEAPIFTNCRQIITVHDLIPLRFPKRLSPLTNYFRYYVPQILMQAEQIICDSTATATDLMDFFKIPSTKITPILLGYDRERFNFLNLPKSNYFLYIGRQDTYKNLHRVISAFAAINHDRDYELWLVGATDSRYSPNLQAQIAELGLFDRVKFLEYVPYHQLPTIINQAIALVFPSLWEGFGLPILEAMACGTPVITSNLASMPEVAGSAAILVAPNRVNEISDAMKMVAEDSQLHAELRQAGLARVQQFSWEKTGQATAELLNRYL